jgi:hypothetical protein
MSAMRKHINRQGDAWAVILLALLSVILYTLWGASVLRAEQANAGQGTVAVANS